MSNLGYSTMSMIPTMKGARSAFQAEVDELMRQTKADVAVKADTSEFVDKAKEAGTEGGDGLVSGIAAAAAGATAAAALVGAAAAAGFAKALADGIDQDNLDRMLGAQNGLSPDQARAAGNAAGDAYASGFGDSQASAADALTAARVNFSTVWDPSQLEDISKKALGIADIFGGDVAEATRAASNLVKNGLAANADEAFDLITKGYQNGLNVGGDFLDTINEYSVQWHKVGLSGADALGQLERGLLAGARDTDFLADAQKEFAIRAIDGSDTTTKAYADLRLSAWQMSQAIAGGGPAAKDAMSTVLQQLGKVQDKVKRDQIGVALFGTKWEDVGQQVVAGLDPALGGLENFQGATDEALAQAGGGLGNMVENWKRSAEVGLGNFAQENITPALERMQQAWSEGGISGLWDQILVEGSTIGDKLRAGLDVIIPQVQSWLQENGPAIAAKGQEILKGLVEWGGELRTQLVDNLSIWLPQIGEWIENTAVPFIEEHAGDWVSAFLAWAGPMAQQALEALGRFLVAVGGWIVTDFIPWAQQKSAEWGWALLQWLVNEAQPWAMQKLDELRLAIGAWITDTAVPWLIQKGGELRDSILQWLSELPGKIADAAPGVWDALVTAAEAAFKAILEAWNQLSLDIQVPDWVPGIGGKSFDVLPDVPIPTFHQGGIVPGSGERLALLQGGEGVFTEGQMAAMGSTIGDIYVQGASQPMQTAWAVRNTLRAAQITGLN